MEPKTDQLYDDFDKSLYRVNTNGDTSVLNTLLANPNTDNSKNVQTDSNNLAPGFSTTIMQLASTASIQQGKKKYTNDDTGFILGFDPTDEFSKFYIGNSTNYLNWTGSSLVISGQIIGGSISIGSGNAVFKVDSNGMFLGNTTFASAPFSVDMNGNATVSSLQRRDFHWFTLFESLSGYSVTVQGTGTATLGFQYFTLTTSATNGDNVILTKSQPNAFGEFSWDKNRKIKFGFFANAGGAGLDTNIGCGGVGGQNRQISITLSGNNGSNYTIYGNVANGSTMTTILVSASIALNTYHLIEIIFISGTKADFYLDGTLAGTITTTLPTGTLNSEILLLVNHSTIGGIQYFRMSFFDFWQGV